MELAVYSDEDVFGAFAEIIAAVPESGGDAQARVTDDGALTWICDYQADAATVPGTEPPRDQDGPGRRSLVEELVTNGVRASRATGRDAVRMWLVSDLGRVAVFVWDASPARPRRG